MEGYDSRNLECQTGILTTTVWKPWPTLSIETNGLGDPPSLRKHYIHIYIYIVVKIHHGQSTKPCDSNN